MSKFIPRKAKIKTEVFRNFTFLDCIIALIGLVAAVMVFASNIPYNIYLGIAVASLWVMLFVPVSDGVKLYFSVVLAFKFFAYKKKYFKNFVKQNENIKRIIPFEGLNRNQYISFGEYYAMVLEIFPIDFFLLDEEKQEVAINTFGNAITRLNKNQKMSVVKIKKAEVLDEMEQYEDYRYTKLQEMSSKGLYSQEELDLRAPIFEERLRNINIFNNYDRILKEHYYIVVYDTDREMLESTIKGMSASLSSSVTPIYSKILVGDELLVFLKSTFTDYFDERELKNLNGEEKVKWAFPDNVQFKSMTTQIDKKLYRTFTISEYPLEVPNAWLYPIFMLPDTRVVVNIEQMDRFKAEKLLDKSLMEMEIKLNKTAKTSQQIENQTHYDTLRELLTSLKNNGETLYNTNIHIVTLDENKKEVRSLLKQNGFRFAENFGRQIDAFVSANISRLDTLKMYERGIHTSSLAAMFPFISSMMQDDHGIYIGWSEYPMFINFFSRDKDRMNSNMVVMGKSGAGKSFATKTLLTNFAADQTRIFILDPENEYEVICNNLNGKIIDVGSNIHGIFNPFHIFTDLKEDEGDLSFSYSAHLQFLEQFFRIILPGIDSDSFETLNSLLIEVYKSKNITENTDLSTLEPEDYPIFDDLLKIIKDQIKEETEPYRMKSLLTVRTYIEKFASGGRYSNLWNGPTSIVTNENFICFNFRNLLGNNNPLITNAQMLLVFKFLNNEITKNKDFNDKYYKPNLEELEYRRVIIAVDEAHEFINKKFPTSLEFMTRMAKRIRKYHGMQIIATQNIKDFVGSEEIAQQSTAIINASQYSLIFSLAPNDMTDLIALYRNAGGINKEEQDAIVTADKGTCFLVVSATQRTTVHIEALPLVRDLFEHDYTKDASELEEENKDNLSDFLKSLDEM